MKDLLIEIRKSAVFDKVSLNTAYTGAKNSTETRDFDCIATAETDETLLEGFWTSMCGKVCDFLHEFIRDTAIDSSALKLNLEVSGSYRESLTPSVAADIESAIAAGVTARWFRFSYPEQSPEWESESQTLLRRAAGKLCFRRRPMRP